MLEYNQFQLAFNIATLLICVTNLVFTQIQHRTQRKQNKAFIIMLCILSLNAISEGVQAILLTSINDSQVAFLGFDIACFIYFITHTMLCPVFFYYVNQVCYTTIHKKSIVNWSLFLCFVIPELLVLTNPFFGAVYKYGPGNVFQRNWGEYVVYASAALFFIVSIAFLMHSWHYLFHKHRAAFVVFAVFTVTGILVQLVNYQLKTELLAEALGLTGMMLCIEDDDFWLDATTSFYNRRALILDLDAYLNNGRNVKLLCLRVINHEAAMKIIGTESNDLLSKVLEEYIKTLVKDDMVYHINPGTFVITMADVDDEKIHSMAQTIKNRFARPWRMGNSIVILDAVVMLTGIPGRFSTVSDIIYMFESDLPHDNDKKILEGDGLNYLIRRADVAKALARGIANNSFSVHYQPTYNLSDRSLHGAEALVRMVDKELGPVYPDEFIPIAESIGIIDDIDDFVLIEVCKFISSGIPAKYGLDCININLSVLQCIKSGFVEHINGIVEEQGVDKKCINFEITESWASDDYKILSNVISSLKAEGFLFSMDDYGTGYSNMSAIFSLDLDVIKIDKSILWGAQESELGMIILENSIRMIKQMNRGILVEGVETEEQIKLLEKLGVNYLQGFYFSRPVPEDKFIEIISNNKFLEE